MKKLLFTFLACSLFQRVETHAQAAFKTMDSLTINNIHASVLVHGDMWLNPYPLPLPTTTPLLPNPDEYRCNLYGTSKPINYAGAIWMSGYDAGDDLHIAVQIYRDNGSDYWPGPIETGTSISYTSSQAWAKIWKINDSDVQYFNSLPTHTTTNTPASILTWPGKGNIYARGNGDAPLTVTRDMAPFVDLNDNGIYEPLLGEYPDFPGEQALWWIFNDNGPVHNQTNGKRLEVEVHAISYGYKRGTLIDNVVYYDYKIVNRSVNKYHGFRFALQDEIDLGWYLDDYLSYDSARRLGICYNGTNDDGGGGGHPVVSFGKNPPMSGVTMISMPDDTQERYAPLGAFGYYNNDFFLMNNFKSGHSFIDTEINFLMRGLMQDSFFFFDFTRTDSLFECIENNTPLDRRFILSSNDLILNAGDSKHFVLALISTDTGNGKGCPNMSFTPIKEVADTAWHAYYHPPAPLHKGVQTTGANALHAYPNPAHDKLYINGADNATITIYNAMGQATAAPVIWNGTQYEIDISALPRGLYNARYNSGSVRSNIKFLKE